MNEKAAKKFRSTRTEFDRAVHLNNMIENDGFDPYFWASRACGDYLTRTLSPAMPIFRKGDETMEKNCENCKHWGRKNFIYSEKETRICMLTNDPDNSGVEFVAHTAPDMSCPRFSPKEPEIPAALKDWKPVWHPESEKPQSGKFVLGRYKLITNWWGVVYYEAITKIWREWPSSDPKNISWWAKLP